MTRFLFCIFFAFASSVYPKKLSEKPLVILTTSYNNRQWVEPNLTSIYSQKYSNYRVIYVDDASEDGTADTVEQFVKEQPKEIRFDLIRNKERLGALANIFYAIHNCCKDDEIIVSLDGDDRFYDDNVLKTVNKAYSTKDIWLTHGTMLEFPSLSTKWCKPIPHDIIASNKFRTFRCPTHLRTFYAWLFKRIKTEDLLYNGSFFPMTWDQAMMFPMIEMAGFRHEFLSTVTYVYNKTNPINDNKVNAQMQRELERYIRSKAPYSPLSNK